MVTQQKIRVAIIVSHPIQYYIPLYQKLAQRSDISIKVFFTWHAGQAPVKDQGFGIEVSWDIPLTQGYEFELVSNLSADPGTHHFLGLRNPTLIQQVVSWRPDVVHITGWAWLSHLAALRAFAKFGIPTLFRGDSHLLDGGLRGTRWWLKKEILKRVFSWPSAFLVVGQANRAYYKRFGVAEDRLFDCPHSIEVSRFAEPAVALERKAAEWREGLGINEDHCVLVFAGKFEPKKRPLELMRAVREIEDTSVVLVMVGSGELEEEVYSFAATDRARFLVLPFQNQSRMPLVYRIGDLCVLPSAYGETWGLAVNEAMACGRPVLVSDRVGCAYDLVDDSCGRIFSSGTPKSLRCAITKMIGNRDSLHEMRRGAAERAKDFDIVRTENALVKAIYQVFGT